MLGRVNLTLFDTGLMLYILLLDKRIARNWQGRSSDSQQANNLDDFKDLHCEKLKNKLLKELFGLLGRCYCLKDKVVVESDGVTNEIKTIREWKMTEFIFLFVLIYMYIYEYI